MSKMKFGFFVLIFSLLLSGCNMPISNGSASGNNAKSEASTSSDNKTPANGSSDAQEAKGTNDDDTSGAQAAKITNEQPWFEDVDSTVPKISNTGGVWYYNEERIQGTSMKILNGMNTMY
ncbi:hypothetical protein [Marininema halotolerans]|uniref:Uncharacterized protein n=1 Tax=Marininema halotolerans TaxID=1155944 RepID=A0A1I6RJ72_9BACL|nr:hypothetical protein [Marininema halotolerans]SFS64803.1 hypothetical protein SAMN05444972_105133 [Marininema halotolerans]